MNSYINLAKKAVENYIKEGKIIEIPNDLPKRALEEKSGTFVTIMKKEELRDLPRSKPKVLLRGCIGTYLPTRRNIAEEIIYNAIAAATEDYRFWPIKKEELPYLSYIVYILNKPELVRNINELDPKKYGIIVKTAPITFSRDTDVMFNGHLPSKTGLLLPDLEGVDTVEKQISIACQKGGIDITKEKLIIYRFRVEKYQ